MNDLPEGVTISYGYDDDDDFEWSQMALMEIFEEAKELKNKKNKGENTIEQEKEFEEDYGVTYQDFLEKYTSCGSCQEEICNEEICV